MNIVGQLALVLGDEYAVTTGGQVFSNKRGVLRELRLQNSGHYYQFGVSIGGKTRTLRVHRIVAETFLGPAPNARSVVMHLNGDRLDNRIENLAWGTPAQNSSTMSEQGRSSRGVRGNTCKLSRQDVVDIRSARAAGEKIADIAARFGVHGRTIFYVLRNKRRGDS